MGSILLVFLKCTLFFLLLQINLSVSLTIPEGKNKVTDSKVNKNDLMKRLADRIDKLSDAAVLHKERMDDVLKVLQKNIIKSTNASGADPEKYKKVLFGALLSKVQEKLYRISLNNTVLGEKYNETLTPSRRSEVNYDRFLKVDSKTPVIGSKSMYVSKIEYSEPVVLVAQGNFTNENATTTSTIEENEITEGTVEPQEKLEDADDLQISKIFKRCICNEINCVNDKECDEECKSICVKSFNLGRINCYPSANATSVPLDFLCDDKKDCPNGKDEQDCSFGMLHNNKFEINKLLDLVSDIIQKKFIFNDQGHAPNPKTWSLIKNIFELQKEFISSSNHSSIKGIRDDIFNLISEVYSDLIIDMNKEEENELHQTLLTANELIVRAFKMGRTGNGKVVIIKKCVCDGTKCEKPNCSEYCKRYCSVDMQFTKYHCKGDKTLDKLIPLEKVCNGEPDCVYGEDELNCNLDLCRSFHVKLLDSLVQQLGAKDRGTALGERVKSWKKDLLQDINGLEKPSNSKNRIPKADLMDVLKKGLVNLVKIYAKQDTGRRDTDTSRRTYSMIAKQLKNAVRYCGK